MKLSRIPVIFGVCAVLAAGAISAAVAAGNGSGDDVDDDGAAAVADATNSAPASWIPGERSQIEICVDVLPMSVSQDLAYKDVAAAVEASRRVRPEIWVGAFAREPELTLGCPIKSFAYVPAQSIEHRVKTVSGPLLFVFVQGDARPVPGGFQRLPYETYGGRNGYEATTVLFVSVAVTRDSPRLQAAIEFALGLGWEPSPNPDGPPDPDATKPPAPTVSP